VAYSAQYQRESHHHGGVGEMAYENVAAAGRRFAQLKAA
jgi:hypothetical protein